MVHSRHEITDIEEAQKILDDGGYVKEIRRLHDKDDNFMGTIVRKLWFDDYDLLDMKFSYMLRRWYPTDKINEIEARHKLTKLIKGG